MYKAKLEYDKKYYREYMTCCGYGVMIAYDTVMAKSVAEAYKKAKRSPYGDDLEYIIKVPLKHYKLSDEELSKIYGQEE